MIRVNKPRPRPWCRWLWLMLFRRLGGNNAIARKLRDQILNDFNTAIEVGCIRERRRTLDLIQRCKMLGLSLDDLRAEIIAESVDEVGSGEKRQQFNAEGCIRATG